MLTATTRRARARVESVGAEEGELLQMRSNVLQSVKQFKVALKIVGVKHKAGPRGTPSSVINSTGYHSRPPRLILQGLGNLYFERRVFLEVHRIQARLPMVV